MHVGAASRNPRGFRGSLPRTSNTVRFNVIPTNSKNMQVPIPKFKSTDSIANPDNRSS